MDDLLLDYLLDQLSPSERAAVSTFVSSDPELAARLNAMSAVLTPLAADAEPDEPPPGLADAAVARTAEFVVANGLFTARDGFATATPYARYRESGWLSSLRGWVNVAATAAVVLLVIGLSLTAVGRARQSYQTAACQNNLRELHDGLTGYGETHGGKLPQAGTPAVPFAGEVFDELARGGQGVSAAARQCPTVLTAQAGSVGYAYSLGFRDTVGHLIGPTLPDPFGDETPVAADLPTAGAHSGWNVLTVGGGVRFLRSSTLASGDDIFHNDHGQRQAGLHRGDVCLGRPFDVP